MEEEDRGRQEHRAWRPTETTLNPLLSCLLHDTPKGVCMHVCLCLCAGTRKTSVCIRDSFSEEGKEVASRVSVWLPCLCGCACACELGVCACRRAHWCWGTALPSVGTPKSPSGPLWTTSLSPLQAPRRLTSRVDQTGKAQGLPSSASVLALQG